MRRLAGLFVACIALAHLPASAEPDPTPVADKPTKKTKKWVENVGPLPLGAPPPELLHRAREVRNLPLAERMKAISDLMLDAPYVSDPLGEGTGHDADPFARYDVYDCLTFVEEVLSLSLSGDPEHAAEVRLDLRYGEQSPRYETRHHFMELQWLPRAIGAGWTRDTTTSYGPTTRYEKEVNLELWSSWSKRDNFSMIPDDMLPMGTIGLDILSIDDALAAIDTIPPGAIILTVREDLPSNPLWISHVGFVVPAAQPTVRHATRMGSVPRVRDHGLRWYLENMKRYRGWKAVGISILEPVEQGPRLAVLPSDEG